MSVGGNQGNMRKVEDQLTRINYKQYSSDSLAFPSGISTVSKDVEEK